MSTSKDRERSVIESVIVHLMHGGKNEDGDIIVSYAWMELKIVSASIKSNQTRHLNKGIIRRRGGFHSQVAQRHKSYPKRGRYKKLYSSKTPTWTMSWSVRPCSCSNDRQSMAMWTAYQWARFSRPATKGHIRQDRPPIGVPSEPSAIHPFALDNGERKGVVPFVRPVMQAMLASSTQRGNLALRTVSDILTTMNRVYLVWLSCGSEIAA